jgi:hypothetical protein
VSMRHCAAGVGSSKHNGSMNADGKLVTLANLLFGLLATPVCAALYTMLACFRRSGPASRFILLGLLPSASNTVLIAQPGYTGHWFAVLRRYWPPQLSLLWLFDLLSNNWMVMPSFVAVLIFGAELLRPDRFSAGMIRGGVAIAYLGVAGILQTLLFGNWE